MYYGFGGRRGAGRGIRGGRGGGGFGFRGSSSPWPYIGLGRGGLPRCGYYLNRASGLSPAFGSYGQTPYFNSSSVPQMNPEQDLGSLKSQAEAIGEQLAQIEKRMRELENEK